MRKSLFSILAVLALAPTVQAQGGVSEAVALKRIAADAPKFVLTDGYVQSTIRQPFHLVHGTPPEIKVRLGEDFRLWFDVQLAPGVTSPCTSRHEKPCYYEFRLAKPGVARDKIPTDEWSTDEVRFTNGDSGKMGMSLAYPVTRDAVVGHRVLYVRIRYADRSDYLLAIPFLIEE